ncbi:hypothetical protein BDN67DRAFT_915357, partial [Paxillus ammoniavirescens]
FNIPKLELFQSFADSVKKVGNLIQFTADVSECLLITHCKHLFQKTSRQRDFTTQYVCILNREETMCFFELYTLLREGGGIANQSLMTYVDLMLSWVRRALSKMEAETRFTAPCPIRNHFLKDIISNNFCTALHVTIKPDLLSMTIDTIQQQYHLPDFTNTFYNYLCQHTDKADLNKAFQMPLKT